MPGPSTLDADALAVDGAGGHPAVDPPAVVADLEARPLNGLDEVQVLAAPHLAQDDVADLERRGVNRLHRAELPRLDLAGHRVAARPEGHRLAGAQLRDVPGRPAHGQAHSRGRHFSLPLHKEWQA